MRGFGATALALLLALPQAAVAQDANAPVHVGMWLIGPLDALSCQMETHFGDHYLVNISEDSSGIGRFIFRDDRWILKDGDTKPATYSWDGWKTSHEGTFRAVRSPSGGSFLVMETNAGFTEEMAGATGLWLRVPGVDFDDDFAIPDANALVTAVAECNSKH